MLSQKLAERIVEQKVSKQRYVNRKQPVTLIKGQSLNVRLALIRTNGLKKNATKMKNNGKKE